MNKALADFAQNPLEYDLSEMMDNEEIQEMARDVEALRKELYEAAGRNRDYHVKAEDVKSLLPDWKGADGCIATNRITVEGYKVGYCYREKPDGDWDSGWRFTAGDESEEYMDDPNNAGIYKLNTICNDDPDIIPLLNTPTPYAFERDENGVCQQIKDWKPDEDEEDPDMDILKQCQKWHEEDKHQKIVDALEAISAEERTPEMDMELARAYNNLADSSEPEGRKLLHQALELMQSHEEELGDNTDMTHPLILAKIPVKNPWEIFAYLPFGNWNDCPDTPELMAAAKYWFEQHGAVPAAMSHDELEFLLPAPVHKEKAMDAAVELYGFCPDVIDQGPEDATVGALADVLRQSTVWYLWWD